MSGDRCAQQRDVAAWFDGIYRKLGPHYLRPRHAYLIFLELLGATRDDRLLDVACGPGVLLQAASEYTDFLHGIDISHVALARAMADIPNAQLIRGNAERLPYRSGSFDLITCLGSLERFLDVSNALAEMRRVGKRHAKYCFLVRNSNTYRWRLLAGVNAIARKNGHAGADSLDNWRNLLESSGFSILDALPDQYPLHRRRRWSSLYLQDVDYRAVQTDSSPLDRANEFIFVLQRRH